MTGESIQGAIAGMLVLASLAVLPGCRGEERETEVEMQVRRVALDPASQSPVVVLENHDRTVSLPIWIGVSEAQAIAMEMEGVRPPRPLTHDLVKTVLERVGVQFNKALISELRGNTYHARLFLTSNGGDLEIDSRPSDAIALAIRFRKPIFVATVLLQRAGTEEAKPAAGAESITIGGLTVQVLSKDLAEHFGVAAGRGVLVADVDGEADSELTRGDIIIEIDGSPVRGVADFRDKVAAIGRRAHLSVRRGKEQLQVAFEPLPQ
ncbi:MAG: hypothetical protein A3J75_04910 [Acidobacteria bacterium RBG_16_68_9]|nr:MAG: hypothetical protein A3J75_04910 [Acidobacteria bacterium RBG_16_68_9]